MKITTEMIDFAENQRWDEDVRQDVYVVLLEKDDGYMKKASVPQLMTSIYNLLVLNGFRQESRRKELALDNVQAIEGFHGVDDVAEPGEYMDAEDILNRISHLSPLLSNTLEDYINGYSIDEIAARQNTNDNTIYQRIHAIKQELHNG